MKNRAPFSLQRRLKGIDGKWKWFSTRGAPIIDEDGILACYYGTCSDNTEDRELEREMKILPECLPQMVWKCDMDGDVLYSNQKFKSYVGAAEDALLNVFSDKLVHKDDYKHSLAVFKKAIKDKTEFESKRRLLSAGGYYKRFTSRGTPVFDGKGEIKFFYGTCEDDDQ